VVTGDLRSLDISVTRLTGELHIGKRLDVLLRVEL
jgi:hypothetical protein